MSGSSTTSSLWQAVPKPLAPLFRWMAGSAATFSTLLAFLLLVRSLTGAVQPLEPPVLLPVGVLLALLASAVRIVWLYAASSRRSPLNLVALLLPLPALLITAAALSYPQPLGALLLFFWGVLLAEESFWWLSLYGSPLLKSPLKRPASGDGSPSPELPAQPQSGSDAALSDAALGLGLRSEINRLAVEEELEEELEGEEAESLPPGVSQQLTRSRDETGAEVLYGMLRGEFASGERAVHLHLAFCPPFKTTPQLQVHQLDGAPASVKAVAVHTFGARLDLKLASLSSEPQETVLEVYARAEPPQEN